MIRVSLITLDKYKREGFMHEKVSFFSATFLLLSLSCVEKSPLSNLGFRVEICAKKRSKDPPSTSFTPRTPVVVEPLVDKGARSGQRRLATDHASKV